MSLMSGLRKVFHKKRPFEPIDRYRLTSEEKEKVIAFFSVIGTVLSIILITLIVQ
ncbi:hypothetical protein [Mahella sp.]|uniref:hypothetical protein n=1 Tax=Mahella sp. TaxID=2798721 RepID=UPI0025B825DF|nr:hypothetical protein [Mahella sp.]MBZ4665978.1 hypothetical protein [Mahella sp.]